MSISLEVIRLLARFIQKTGVSGRMLTYGVQGVEGQYADLLKCLEKERFPARRLNPAEIQLDSRTTEYGHSLHQDALFKTLGFDTVESLDLYPDEHPTHQADLNQPLPENLWGQYDLVFDGGTMEHCLNVKEVLFNSARLVKDGGYILHLNPVSGLVNHGFYQFSPTLYFDFYGENGFDQPDLKLLLEGRYLDFTPGYVFNDFLGEPALGLFTARKAETRPLILPVQNAYRQKFESASADTAPAGSGLSGLKEKIPSRTLVKCLLEVRKRMQLRRFTHKL